MVIRVAIIDQQPIFRVGLNIAFSATDGYEIIGEGNSCSASIDAVKRLSPDVMLFDVELPGAPLSTVRRIFDQFPHVKLIAMSNSTDWNSVKLTLSAGAIAYLLRTASRTEFCDAIDKAHKGEPHIPSKLATDIVFHHCRPKEIVIKSKLLHREGEVLGKLILGRTNSEIANDMSIKLDVAKRIVANVYRKLAVRNRTEALMLVNSDNIREFCD